MPRALACPSAAYVLCGEAGITQEIIEHVHGPKLGHVWRLLAELAARNHKAVVVGQLNKRYFRRLAMLLRQLGMPCACAAGSPRFQASEIKRFHSGACPRIILSAQQMRGLELPDARHVIFLHAPVETAVGDVSRWVARSALHPRVEHHHFPLRRTVEDVLRLLARRGGRVMCARAARPLIFCGVCQRACCGAVHDFACVRGSAGAAVAAAVLLCAARPAARTALEYGARAPGAWL